MAGSIRSFDYLSDDGELYRISRDESNTEALNPSDVGALLGTAKYPTGYETRYALLYQVSNPEIKRKVTILTPERFSAILGNEDFLLSVIGAVPAAFRVSALIGERRTGLVSGDTGQNDGDSPL